MKYVGLLILCIFFYPDCGFSQKYCDSVRISKTYLQSVDLAYRFKIDSAIQIVRQDLDCSRASEFEYGEARMLQQLASLLLKQEKIDTAQACLAKALSIARENGFKRVEVDVLNSIGDGYIANIVFSDLYGREDIYSKGLEIFMSAKSLAEEIDYKEGLAYASLKAGYVNASIGNRSLARSFYRQSLAQSAAYAHTASRWLGASYNLDHNYDSTFYWYRKASELSFRMSDYSGYLKSRQIMGELFLEHGKTDSAYAYQLEALAKSKLFNIRHEVIWSHRRLADVLAKRGDYTSCFAHYDSAVAGFKEDKDIIGLSMTFLGYGKNLAMSGRDKEAEHYLLEAMRYGRMTGDYFRYGEALDATIKFYTVRNDLKKVFEVQSQEITFLDSLNKLKLAIVTDKLTQSERNRQIQTLKEQNEKAKEELRQQKNLKRILLASILIAFVIMFMVYWALRIKRNSNNALEVQNAIISAQKEELRASIDNLKEVSAKLFQSEKMASLGLLTAGVAHEINNPLNFISGGVQALDMTVKDLIDRLKRQNNSDRESVIEIQSEADELLGTVNTGIDRATKIVNSLRVFSRTEESKMEQISVKECMDLATTIMSFKIKSSRVKITWRIEDSFFILGNASQLVQVFTNLIDNALQAMEHVSGEKVINIKVIEEGDWKVLLFQDNGAGIPESVRHRIFDPFFTTKEVGKGTGLGLSISHSIIEKHGGKMDFESDLGKGTTFKVYLKAL